MRVGATLWALTLCAGHAHAQWSMNGTVVYYNNGNVGLGTTLPGARIQANTPLTTNGTKAIFGFATGATGVTNGVYGQTASNAGRGIFGIATAPSGLTFGAYGQSNSSTGRGVLGLASATSGLNYGVFGQSSSSSGQGVYGFAAATTGINIGVHGRTNSPDGYAGYFEGDGYFSGFVGIGTPTPIYRLHVVDSLLAVGGLATSQTGLANGVQGQTNSPVGFGVLGKTNAVTGFACGLGGQSDSPIGGGVFGDARHPFGENFGLFGQTASYTNGWGIYSEGDLGASGFKAFHIDHPLRPATHYLNHYSVEGPEALLIYRGTVVMEQDGSAWASLPGYFETMNREFHYQLTAIGAPAVLYVADEIKDNRFRIAGGKPGLKVCWTVTGTRNDPYARAYGKPVEQQKPQELIGRFVHPELYGKPESTALSAQIGSARQQ